MDDEEKLYCKDCEFWAKLGVHDSIKCGECTTEPPQKVWNSKAQEFQDVTPITDAYRKACRYFKRRHNGLGN